MSVPLFDCRIDQNGLNAVGKVFASGHLATGAHVIELERAISSYVGGREAVAVANMTQALEIALRLAGVGVGDEVLTLSFNCLSSNSAIHNVGAKPVWVDLDPETASMSIDDAHTCLSTKTRALVVYHVAGYPSNIDGLRNFCDEARICLIEDANAAFGTRLPSGARAGTVGDYAIFSFYANRQINAIEGAALICPDAVVASRARRLRRYGINQDTFRDGRGEINPISDVNEIGISAAMSNVNSVLALESMKTFPSRHAASLDNAEALVVALQNFPSLNIVRPVPYGVASNWVLLLMANNREHIVEKLRLAGVASSKLHEPNHTYSGFGSEQRPLPGTHTFARTMFAIPCGWWVDATGRETIVSAIRSAL